MDQYNLNNLELTSSKLVGHLFTNLGNVLKKYVGYVLLVPLIGAGYLAYSYYSDFQLFKNDPQAATNQLNQKLVGEISKIILLPNEQPTVATVSDPESLKGQAFFDQAKLGDKVLIYTGAKKAVLYDPNQKKVIEVAPLNVGAGSQAIFPQSPK